MQSVIQEVIAERARQDDKWGGPEHDDQHSISDFLGFIWTRVHIRGNQLWDIPFMRKNLIQIAALAIAAVESIDRKAADTDIKE